MKKWSAKIKSGASALALLSVLSPAQIYASTVDVLSLQEAQQIAEEGYIYGLPIVMNYGTMYEFAIDRNSGQFKAPLNHIHNMSDVATYKDTAVVTPNSDTPYSILWVDLRAEPMVVSVPAMDPKRYYSVQLVDGNTFNYGYIGSRASGSEAGDYMIVGPEWQGETPPGVKKVFRSTTQFSFVNFRTQLFDPSDIDNVVKVQAGYHAQPLSAYLNQPPAPASPVVNFPKFDAELAQSNFFEYLDFSLQFAPALESEKDIRAKLARLGVGPGKTYDIGDLSAEHKAAILLGMKAGERKVVEGVAEAGVPINGWRVMSVDGDPASYNGDALKRAVLARAGIYGNDSIEAVYPITRIDKDGKALDGSKHDYSITFPAGQLPPVNSFWSVTMYDGKTQFLIENPINRYLINSPMLSSMKHNDDGSLTIHIQKDSPGKDKEANWLPAPDGPIYMVMRLYWPKTEAPSILPVGKGTWQPPSVVATH